MNRLRACPRPRCPQGVLRVVLDNWQPDPALARVERRVALALAPAAPNVAFSPFADSDDLLRVAYNHRDLRYDFRFALHMRLAPPEGGER